jgi:hypothetical protein
MEHLESDGAVMLEIVREIDGARAATRDLLYEPVAIAERAGQERWCGHEPEEVWNRKFARGTERMLASVQPVALRTPLQRSCSADGNLREPAPVMLCVSPPIPLSRSSCQGAAASVFLLRRFST